MLGISQRSTPSANTSQAVIARGLLRSGALEETWRRAKVLGQYKSLGDGMAASKWHGLRGVAAATAAAVFASCLAGCGADLAGGLQTQSITSYEAANALSPTGYQVTDLGDGRIRVTATGSAATPKARVEKIAVARAAEYGIERNSKYFQTSAPQFSIRCGKRDYVERGQKKTLPARGYSVVEIDVVYAATPADASYRPARETGAALRAELQSETVADADKQAAFAEVAAQCGM